MSTWGRQRNRRGRRQSQSQSIEADTTYRDYGYGFSDEGRPIAGQIGYEPEEQPYNPQAQAFDELGETTVHDLSQQRAIKMCAPDQHNLVPDETEEDFEAVTCTKCPFGMLFKHK